MAVSSNDRAFHFEDRGDYSVLVFRAALNDEWTRVHEYGDVMLQNVRAASSPRLLLDLGELDICGSAVVAVMVKLWKELRGRGGVLAVYCPSPAVRDTLSLARLTDLWEVHPDRQAAEQALLGGYTASEARGRWGVLSLALLGVVACAAMTALLFFSATVVMPAVACGSVAALSLLLAVVVWGGVPRSVALARAWAVVVAVLALLGLGFTLGHGVLEAWHKAVLAVVLVAAVLLCWLVWRVLESVESPSE